MNSIADMDEIDSGAAADTNANRIPDECEPVVDPDSLRRYTPRLNAGMLRDNTMAMAFSNDRLGRVYLRVVDISGEVVRILIEDDRLPVGHHNVRWDLESHAGVAVPVGVYEIRLQLPTASLSRRVAVNPK